MKRPTTRSLFIVTCVAICSIRVSAQTPAPATPKATRNLAILIFDGVQIIDYTGPYETFGHTYVEDGQAFNI